MKSTMRLNAAACASDQIPLSQSVMGASGETPLASTQTNPAPPTAREPRCTKCQSFGMPLSEEYWHIGETQTRFRNVTERRVSGVKSFDMGREHSELAGMKRHQGLALLLSAIRRLV